MLATLVSLLVIWLIASGILGWLGCQRLWKKEDAALKAEDSKASPRRARWLDVLRLSFASGDTIIANIEGVVLTLALLTMVALYFYHMLDGSMVWQSKLPIFLMLWVGFLGASLATRDKKHLAVEAVYKAAPVAAKPVLRVLSGLLACAVCLVLAFLGWGFTIQTYNLRNTERLVPLPASVIRSLEVLPQGLAPLAAPISGWSETTFVIEQSDGTLRKLVTFPNYKIHEGKEQQLSWDPWYDDARDYAIYSGFAEGWAEDGSAPFLGVELDSLRVRTVVAGSGAERAGLLPGDLLLKIDRKQASAPIDWGEVLGKKKPGEQLRLEVERVGSEQSIRLEAVLGPSIALVGIPKWFIEAIMPATLLLMALRFLFGESLAGMIAIVQIGFKAAGKQLLLATSHDGPDEAEVEAAAAQIAAAAQQASAASAETPQEAADGAAAASAETPQEAVDGAEAASAETPEPTDSKEPGQSQADSEESQPSVEGDDSSKETTS